MFDVIILSVALILRFTSAQDANCDFVQNVQPNQSFDLKSPNYPNSYNRGIQCRWIITCPRGYNLRMDCPEVVLPQSDSCRMDRLLVSTTGDPQLYGAAVVCGRNPFTVTSTAQQLSMALITSKYSPGGGFSCRVYTQVAQPTQPTCRCGERKRNRIVGGQNAEVNEFPMMAGLVDVGKVQIVCGATIISNRHVLSAAHCVENQSPNNIGVLVGEHDISVGNDTNSARAYRTERFITHPQYNSANYDYDIAIVVTSTLIQFNEQVGPACLPFKYANYDFTGAKVTLTGWGSYFPGGPVAKVLQKVDVDVISQAQCRSYGTSVTDRQMCTYSPGKDACQYDSGGPLLYTDQTNGLLYHVGIISFGRFCASGYPGVNTRITELLGWIATTTQANFCRT